MTGERGGVNRENAWARSGVKARYTATIIEVDVKAFGLFLLMVFVGAACSSAQPEYQKFSAPDALDDGWKTTSLEAEGLNTETMAEVTSFIRRDPHGDFRSLVIVRNGRLVFEGYFNGHDRDSLHDIRSATKSFTTALVGIAITEGLVGNVETPVFPALKPYAPFAHNDELKQAITVENLLTMASGLDADEDEPSSPGYEDRLWESADWVRFALDLPMVRTPGQRWAYASVNTFILGVIVEEAYKKPLSAYAQDRLFTPLGITDFHWASTPLGRTVAQGNLSLRARDMAKLGQLYLDGGCWVGVKIIPEAWVRTSTTGRYPVPWDGYDTYGYGWYLHTLTVNGRAFRYYFASGNGGNKIYVLPNEQMVVTIQSAAYNTNYGQQRSLEVLRRVLAALAV